MAVGRPVGGRPFEEEYAAIVGDDQPGQQQPPPHPHQLVRSKARKPLRKPWDERYYPVVVVLGFCMLLVGAALRCGSREAVARTTDPGHASTAWVHFSWDHQPQPHAWTVQAIPPGDSFPRGAHWLRVATTTTSPQPFHTTTRPPIRLVVPPTGSLATTAVQARTHHCGAAVNGGPFHADGSSVGVLVVNGSLVKDDTLGPSIVGFGVTRPRRRHTRRGNRRHDVLGDDNNTKANHLSSWVLGTPPSQAVLADLEWFVTGFDWLVREGVNVASHDATGARRAARTAVGIDGHDGSVVLLVADGCERW